MNRGLGRPVVAITEAIVLALVFAMVFATAAHAAGPPVDPIHDPAHPTGPEGVLSLPAAVRADFGTLVMQDFQGRMKPIDTLADETVRKLTKQSRYQDWSSLDLYLSWIATPDYWWEQPLLYVRDPGVKAILGVSETTTHVSPASLFGEQGDYRLLAHVDAAFRTPDRDRTKVQRKLIAFDERMNLVYLSLQGRTLRVFPIPGDSGNAWDTGTRAIERTEESLRPRYREATLDLVGGLHDQDAVRLQRGIDAVHALQAEFGADVMPSRRAIQAELALNRGSFLTRILWPYLFAFLLLLPAYFLSLVRLKPRVHAFRRLLFNIGMLIYVGAFALHLYAYVLRWIASGRAPLSNGFESLLFISLAVGLAGLFFEWRERRGAAAGLSALLAFVVLGISMASHFDPAIGLLVPVLDSYWLIIHVTVITASYGFLGLGGALGALILILHLMKGPGRDEVRRGIAKLDTVLFRVLAWGIALLTIGTILGGVWANESWGRYWGWDPKETWSLVTILVYVAVQHFRWLPSSIKSWVVAAGSLAGIACIVMTYFGVNYFLSGLHSYAQGSTPQIPAWVYVGSALMLALIGASYAAERHRNWGDSPES